MNLSKSDWKTILDGIMELTFNPENQYLSFKQIYLDSGDIIFIYKGNSTPSFVIDPNITTQEMMIDFWNQGLVHLFDVFDNVI